MSKKAKIVIGANFGDEGKGLVTDFLTSQTDKQTLIIRHNGGAQAAHTVQLPNGHRHVFKHFGSGSFLGAHTYLSRFFVCNPILFFQELEKLNEHGLECPTVYISPQSPVTTPYDMMINQMIEEDRAGNRHGSCGVGFGETVERTENSDITLFFKDLNDDQSLRKKLEKIQTHWVPERLKALGIETITDEWQERLQSDEIFERYIEEVENFLNLVSIEPHNLLNQYEDIIFEGAQGLLLDQDHEYFPHVTRSYTGIKNACIIAAENNINDLEVTYITRAYNTRHGAGPFEYELPEKPYEKIIDQTNIYNMYQHDLRFGWLNIDKLKSSIKKDLENKLPSLNIVYNLAVTCLDQVDDQQHTYVLNGVIKSETVDKFLLDLNKAISPQKLLTSHGPTRQDLNLKL